MNYLIPCWCLLHRRHQYRPLLALFFKCLRANCCTQVYNAGLFNTILRKKTPFKASLIRINCLHCLCSVLIRIDLNGWQKAEVSSGIFIMQIFLQLNCCVGKSFSTLACSVWLTTFLPFLFLSKIFQKREDQWMLARIKRSWLWPMAIFLFEKLEEMFF